MGYRFRFVRGGVVGWCLVSFSCNDCPIGDVYPGAELMSAVLNHGFGPHKCARGRLSGEEEDLLVWRPFFPFLLPDLSKLASVTITSLVLAFAGLFFLSVLRNGSWVREGLGVRRW